MKRNYRCLFKSLKERGVENIWLAVSDAHPGLKAAIGKEFLGSSWQRCKVHFMRNILAKVKGKNKEIVASKIKHIWNQPDEKSAREYAKTVMDELEVLQPEAVNTLEVGLEDSLQFYAFPKIDQRKISSTNMLERVNLEIRRRSRVVYAGVVPTFYRRICSFFIPSTTFDYISQHSPIISK